LILSYKALAPKVLREAGIVSAPLVIVVSLTGIASFAIPRFNFAFSIRILRFPLMFLAGLFGLYGMVIGTMWIATHLCSLRSFGVPYLGGYPEVKTGGLKDVLLRVPLWAMSKRSSLIAGGNRKRMSGGQRPKPPHPAGEGG